MADTFETSVKLRLTVPATEVDRVKKIVNAAVNPSTIRRIQAVPSMVGITGGPSPAAITPNAGIGGSLMSGIGDMAGQLGIIAAIANQALEFLGKIVGFLASASPALKGVLYQMDRAMLLFFKPFGDFLASMLRPLAISWLKIARGWVKWTKLSLDEKIASIIDPMKKRVESLFSGAKLTDFIEKVGSIWDVVEKKTKSIWEFVDNISKPIWTWISDVYHSIWEWVVDTYHSIWEWVFGPTSDSRSIWNWILTPVKSIWDFITGGGGGGGTSNTPVATGGTTTITGGGSYTVANGTVTSTTGTFTTADIRNAVNAAVSSASKISSSNPFGLANPVKNPFQDFIWRPGSKPQTISSTDTVVGTKGKDQGKNINLGGITINVARMDSKYDAKQMANDVADQVINKLRSMT